LIVEKYGQETVYLPGVLNIVANFQSRHPISTDSINEIHCIDEIFPINDNDSFPWTLQPSMLNNKLMLIFNETDNLTLITRLA
jgi:hypothetical protein